MLHLSNKSAILYTYSKTCVKYNVKYLHKWSGKNTRKQFLDYFIKDNNHSFVRSSPVVPFCDPTVAFVNAGMNQFKGVFLGRQEPVFSRIANSQKCVRVGGKHNDLSVVGTDGYHHTFFEMLGNWSFGDYFKKDACNLAWNLLTGPYELEPSALYVTYFSGDVNLKLDPDLECRDIWRSLGISDERIIPFGLKDNFWEMGPTGPCGPCTEIHIDHTKSNNLRSHQVNRDLHDLTELWNIVFIQYDRSSDGIIRALPQKHVDTGMGLERLTAVLQGKSSNYDTDIFTNLFEIIKKNCKGLPVYGGKFGLNDQNGVDTAYRILTDHARTITVCLADGMIPEQNQKLRKIFRKSLYLAESTFKNEKGLLNELAFGVSENLGDVYPEITKNIKQIQDIISYEEEVYKIIRQTASKEWANIVTLEPRLKNLNAIETPGLVAAYKDLCINSANSITADIAFRMYDAHGLDEETITNLAQVLALPFEIQQLKTELENARNRTKEGYTINQELSKLNELLSDIKHVTNDTFKYDYSKNEKYILNSLDIKVLYIIKDYKIVDEISTNEECYLILDRTNFYTEAGGQVCDIGQIKFDENSSFIISNVLNIHGHLFHKGILKSDANLHIGQIGQLTIDENHRIQIMANHTATHLLNAAIKKVLKASTCQKSSSVASEVLRFDVGVYSRKLSIDDIENIEKLIKKVIKNKVNVETKLIDSQELLSLDNVTLIPGEIYPDKDIRLINIVDENLLSCEPCCGTHVLNTSDIKDFCVTHYRSLGRSTVALTAVTRDRAVWAHKNGKKMLKDVMKIQDNKIEHGNEFRDVEDNIAEIRHRLIHGGGDEDIMPVYVKTKCLNILNETSKKLRGTEREHLKDLINLEMKTVLETNQLKTKSDQQFIVHFLKCSLMLDSVPLQHATKVCKDLPVMVVSYSENMIKARCCVPKKSVRENFNAELWVKESVANVFNSSFSAPRGQDQTLVCNMKAKRINTKDWENLIHKALTFAKKFAIDNL